MAREYVEMLVTRLSGRVQVLLIEKDRPLWQKGKLNLPGGGIEAGETPEQAAVRELKEETGLDAVDVVTLGVIRDRDLVVYCLRGKVADAQQPFKPRDGETEVPVWLDLSEALVDPRLIPNLQAVIPLLHSRVGGWVITDDATATGIKGSHKFELAVRVN
jgi:8-oxo-dGTP pyrophosphatase MutT (NUDIX family)